MKRNNLNPKIIESIKANSKDKNIEEFLGKLLYIEIERNVKGRWNDKYKKAIEEYTSYKED